MPSSSQVPAETLLIRYWDCSGRGIIPRYMAYDAGFDFVDDIISVEETFLGSWATVEKFQPEFAGPFKALPVVKHRGETINETSACAQYVAELAGYMPGHPLDRAKATMIFAHIYDDVHMPISDAIWEFKDWDRDVIGGFGGPTAGLSLKFANLEEILRKNSGDYAVGKAISIADFAIYYIVDLLTRRMMSVRSGPSAVELLFGDKPAIADHQKMMGSRPNIDKFRSSEAWASYGHFLTGKGTLKDKTHELGMGPTELEGFEQLSAKLIAGPT